VSVTVLVGAQWGDEGKGKVAAVLGRTAELAARFQGGPNADHTVCVDKHRFVFRMLPAGILGSGRGVIGNGMVISPGLLVDEIERLAELLPNVHERVFVSLNAHLVFPTHRSRDRGRLARAIRTTGMGVGPAYVDKVARVGVRVRDVLARDCHRELDRESRDEVDRFVRRLADRCVDTSELVQGAIDQGQHVLAEGAQGAMLDLDHGSYPVVTACNTTVGAALSGLGVGPRDVGAVLLVCAAYVAIRGGGVASYAVSRSDRYRFAQAEAQQGASDKPAKYGWLDLSQLRRVARLNGATGLIVTKLDVLDEFPEIRVVRDESARRGGRSEQVFPGWRQPLSGIREYRSLPAPTLEFLSHIETHVGVPIVGISTGAHLTDYVHKPAS